MFPGAIRVFGNLIPVPAVSGKAAISFVMKMSTAGIALKRTIAVKHPSPESGNVACLNNPHSIL